MSMLQVSLEDLIQHPGEETSNAIRARAAAVERLLEEIGAG